MTTRSYRQLRERRRGILVRRLTYLQRLVEEKGDGANHWDRAEASALEWVLGEEERAHEAVPRDPKTGNLP